MVLSERGRLLFSCHCGVRSAQSLARPAVTLKRIVIGIKTGDKGLMKELIDNTHSGAYSPQSHSDRHINTHSCTQTGRFYNHGQSEREFMRKWLACSERQDQDVKASDTSHHLARHRLTFSGCAAGAFGSYVIVSCHQPELLNGFLI